MLAEVISAHHKWAPPARKSAQFLTEAVLISLSGGIVGIAIGIALPISVRVLTNYRIPISGLSVVIAVLVSSLIGVLFGTMPAARCQARSGRKPALGVAEPRHPCCDDCVLRFGMKSRSQC